ncbi:MAG: type II secretion system protein [Armatimonadia bacterium]
MSSQLMKPLRNAKKGFTLVELLVVIGIIAILMAILFPVFQTVREKARQAKCQANLHQIAVALKEFRADHGHYPPAPYWDSVNNKYAGGISDLYPDYIKEKDLFLCPDDRQIDGVEKQAKDRIYSSYNGWVADPGTSWDFETVDATRPDTDATVNGPKRTYNYYAFSEEGWDAFNDTDWPYVKPTLTLPAWLRNEKLRWRHYPALWNRSAPDNTIIVHCVHHRSHFKKDTDKMDAIVTIGGSAKMVNVSQMSHHDTSDAADVSQWVKQSD